jgi:adenylate cyclase
LRPPRRSAIPTYRRKKNPAINIGDVIFDSGDIFGNGVNVVVGLERTADPGGIHVSDRVKEYCGD